MAYMRFVSRRPPVQHKRIGGRPPAQEPIKRIVKRLDDIFSLFIRLRDADNKGVVRCITCNRATNWKHNTDCGHYVSRAIYSTRWDEKNCAGQCKPCNGFKEGEKEKFGEEINKRYGAGTKEMLKIKKNNKFKLERFTLQFLIAEYQNKVLRLRDEKGI